MAALACHGVASGCLPPLLQSAQQRMSFDVCMLSAKLYRDIRDFLVLVQCQDVIVRLTCPSQELGGSIAMHIVATRPLSLDRKSVPAEALEGRQLSSCLML